MTDLYSYLRSIYLTSPKISGIYIDLPYHEQTNVVCSGLGRYKNQDVWIELFDAEKQQDNDSRDWEDGTWNYKWAVFPVTKEEAYLFKKDHQRSINCQTHSEYWNDPNRFKVENLKLENRNLIGWFD